MNDILKIVFQKLYLIVYAMLKCVSLWNQCDIPHSGIVCDIIPLQNFFLISPLSKSMPFIINSLILSLQLDMDIWNYMNRMA